MNQPLTGPSLAQRRKQLGLTQAELADMLGVRSQSVNQWESGRTKPSEPNARRLADLLENYEPPEPAWRSPTPGEVTPPGVLEDRVARLEQDLHALQQAMTVHIEYLEREVDRLRRDRPGDS